MSLADVFTRFSKWISKTCGHPSAFALAFGVVLVWAITGPLFHFSDTWQLIINTGTTVVTFLMVFLIQSTQNRDGAAVQLKLDELIRAVRGAHNSALALEEMTEEELEALKAEYLRLAEQARSHLQQGKAQRPDRLRGGRSHGDGQFRRVGEGAQEGIHRLRIELGARHPLELA